MSDPVVSVACSSHQRRDLVRRLVHALERQTLEPSSFEVVIVDDGSTDGTIDELRSLAEKTPFVLRPVRLETNQGPAWGRNAAWQAANADVIAFIDDDCVPTPEWLSEGLRAMRDRPGVVVGRTMPDPAQEANSGPFSRTVRVEGTRFLNTCNIFYRRSDLEAVGGFHESFTTKGGEDTDLGWRVTALGRDVSYNENALVLHDIRPSSFRAMLKETVKWTDVPRFIAMHPYDGRRLLYKRLFWKNSHAPTVLAMLGIALFPVFPPALIAILPWIVYRVQRHPIDAKHPALYAPGAFVIDALEVIVMIRGSIKHRTLVL